MRDRPIHLIGLCGLTCGFCLGGALSMPFWTALLVRATLPSDQAQAVNRLLAEPLQAFWPVGTLLGGGVWAWTLAQLISLRPAWRMAAAGGISVGLGHLLVTSATFIELANSLRSEAALPVRFALELVLGLGLAAGQLGLAAGLLGLALGVTARGWRVGLQLALASSVAAALPASIVVAALDSLGVRVGSGEAAMAKVVSLAFPAAAVAAGAVVGGVLQQSTHTK
jgi:hypothetical protein